MASDDVTVLAAPPPTTDPGSMPSAARQNSKTCTFQHSAPTPVHVWDTFENGDRGVMLWKRVFFGGVEEWVKTLSLLVQIIRDHLHPQNRIEDFGWHWEETWRKGSHLALFFPWNNIANAVQNAHVCVCVCPCAPMQIFCLCSWRPPAEWSPKAMIEHFSAWNIV